MKKNEFVNGRVIPFRQGKIMLIMKLQLLFLLVFVSQSFAVVTNAQNKRLDLDFNNNTLKEVLVAIEEVSDLSIIYKDKEVASPKLITTSFKNKLVTEILDEVLLPEDLSYQMNGKLVVVLPSNDLKSISEQSGTVSGVVKDTEGHPLPGVTIVVKGTAHGTVSGADGSYSLSQVPDDAILVFSFVGMLTQEILVEDQTRIDITMVVDAIGIEEVVAIGYGVQKKVDLTGAVASVDIKSMEKLGTSNVALALQGLAAGVSVSAAGGNPGGAVDILIRGVGTLNDNTPLYIIDGVPQETMYYLNPEDIESINILKDAASAAIYGTRGANGVILIKTKRGDVGTPKVSFKAYYGVQRINKFMPAITNSADFVRLAKMGIQNAGGNLSDYSFISDYESNPGSFPNSDWQKEYFSGGARSEKYDLSISGGSLNSNYSLSAMYNKEEGAIVRTKREKMSVRINSDIKISDKLKVGESFSVGRSGGRWVNFSDQSYQLLGLPPTIPIRDENNSEGWGYATPKDGYGKIGNPVAAQYIYDNKDDDIHLFGSAYLEFEPIKNLKYTVRASQTIQFWYDYNFTPKFNVGSDFQSANTKLEEERARKYHTVLDHTLSYFINTGDHTIDLLAGASREHALYRGMIAGGQGLPYNLFVLEQAQESQSVGGKEFDSRLQSVFGRVSYNYKNKYFLQSNIRRDGSSRFAEENRYGVFPSFSAGWRISEESFFNVPAVSNMKLRAGYGIIGNQEIGDYAYIATAGIGSKLDYVFGTNQQIYTGSTTNFVPASGIKWETTTTQNIAMDLGMFDSRLNVSVDYYIKRTEDILFQERIPWSVGADNDPYSNVGEMLNKGFDISIGYRNLDNEFKYQVNANISTYDNEVVKMNSDELEVKKAGTPHWLLKYVTETKAGEPIASFYLYPTDGLFKTDAEAEAYVNSDGEMLQEFAKAGDVKFIDTNNDGIIDDDDRVNMGNAIPKLEGSLSFSGSYRNFDFSMLLVGVAGKKMFNANKQFLFYVSDFGNLHEDYLDMWSPSNTESDIPRLVVGDPNGNANKPSALFLEDASYMRLRQLEFGYTLPKTITSRMGIDRLRLYTRAENLFTLTKYTGYDPSIAGSRDIFRNGVDINTYPFAKQFFIGLQLDF